MKILQQREKTFPKEGSICRHMKTIGNSRFVILDPKNFANLATIICYMFLEKSLIKREKITNIKFTLNLGRIDFPPSNHS